MRDFITYAALVSLLLTTLGSLACDQGGPELGGDEFPPDPDLPAAVVELPTPPPASAFEIREFNDDGSMRVEGLITNRDQYMQEEVQVRGVVTEIEGDCDPGEARRRGETCLSPHLFIRDHADDDLRLTVVGYSNDFLRRARIREGEEYLFAGTYKDAAHGFFSAQDGLLELTSVDERDVR